MGISTEFKKFGATLKNVNWSVSAESESGELIVSLWKQYFQKAVNGKILYVDRVSRWTGHGNAAFRKRIATAFDINQQVRAVIAKTDDQAAVDRGQDASKLKNTFSAKTDWVGRVTVWDGDNFEIEFSADAKQSA